MYRLVTYPDAAEQVGALPDAALSAYADILGVLKLVPQNGRLYNEAVPDGLREWVFGSHGEGTVTYLVLEHQREVHVVLVQWIG